METTTDAVGSVSTSSLQIGFLPEQLKELEAGTDRMKLSHALSKSIGHRSNQDPLQKLESAHLIGICGSGMKALAELLTDSGVKVTGSDLERPETINRRLAKRGLRVHQGHADGFMSRDADVVIYSPAIGVSNPERQAATRNQIPQLSYNEMLGYLMRDRDGVCIAGTHGKSTTTAMTATILSDAGLSPSAIVGAELISRETSGWSGTGPLFVVESCEFQRSFLQFHPKYAVVLGIEADHFDYFRDSDDLNSAFGQFSSQVQSDGKLLIPANCPAAQEAASRSDAEVTTFSTSLEFSADWMATDVRKTEFGQRFRVFHHGLFYSEISLQVPGLHTVQNAVAAIALSHLAGAEKTDIRESLYEFQGIRRRFEPVGWWRGIAMVDDYAHHPTAICATLATTREVFGKRKVWAAFQPHQVSRTVALMDDFSKSFSQADEVLIVPAYAAREDVDSEVEQVSLELVDKISSQGISARYCPALDQIVSTIDDEAQPGDVLLTMGAGDIDQVHHEFTRRLQRNHTTQ